MNNIGYKLEGEITVQVEQELGHMKERLQEKREEIETARESQHSRVTQLSATYETEREKTVERYRQVQFE